MLAIALISDIHGNLPALEAVVADISRRAPDQVFVLGDIINGCAWSPEVVDLLLARGWPMLMGNHDDAVLQLGTPRMEARYAQRDHYAYLWWTRERLGDAKLESLSRLPLEILVAPPDVPALRLLHGVPGSFFVGLRPDSPESWATRKLAGVQERIIAGGHTHVAMIRRLGEWFVINSGSVGASYDGDARASYVWMKGDIHGWSGEVCRIPYDLSAVEAGYRVSGLAAAGGVLGEMFHRSVTTALPWVSDFAWWLRQQPGALQADLRLARETYDGCHGPGRWAFPYTR